MEPFPCYWKCCCLCSFCLSVSVFVYPLKRALLATINKILYTDMCLYDCLCVCLSICLSVSLSLSHTHTHTHTGCIKVTDPDLCTAALIKCFLTASKISAQIIKDFHYQTSLAWNLPSTTLPQNCTFPFNCINKFKNSPCLKCLLIMFNSKCVFMYLLSFCFTFKCMLQVCEFLLLFLVEIVKHLWDL